MLNAMAVRSLMNMKGIRILRNKQISKQTYIFLIKISNAYMYICTYVQTYSNIEIQGFWFGDLWMEPWMGLERKRGASSLSSKSKQQDGSVSVQADNLKFFLAICLSNIRLVWSTGYLHSLVCARSAFCQPNIWIRLIRVHMYVYILICVFVYICTYKWNFLLEACAKWANRKRDLAQEIQICQRVNV